VNATLVYMVNRIPYDDRPSYKYVDVGHVLLLFGVATARITLDLPFIANYRNHCTKLRKPHRSSQ